MLFIRVGFNGCADGGTIALGAAAGKNDLVRAGSDQISHVLPGFFDFFGHTASKGVHAGRIAVILAEIRQHGLQNFRRHHGRRIVISIDDPHQSTSSTTSSGVTSSRNLAST